MPRQAGYFEWDDASLTPGQRSEGGLHQNLYDDDGVLQGHARFIPDDDLDLDDEVSSTSYIPTEQRWEYDDDFDLADVVAAVVAAGVIYATPHLKRWWTQSAQPFLSTHVNKITDWWRRDKSAVDGQAKEVAEVEESSVPSHDLDEPGDRPAMSSAEAQARLLAAMAAHTYCQEQLRLVEQACIVDAEGVAEVRQRLSGLSQKKLGAIIEQMVRDPALLQDSSLANLASLLSQEQPTAIE